MKDISKYKALLVDLDGTLVDTSMINYLSYEDAVSRYGYHLDYDYFCKYCNGKHYKSFLFNMISDSSVIEEIHEIKKQSYSQYLDKARLNSELIMLLEDAKKRKDVEGRRECYVGLVTTASKKNTYELLEWYSKVELFDVIITQNDVINKKPDPEGYMLAMNKLHVSPQKTLIFEDSDVGIEAAMRAGAECMRVVGFNGNYNIRINF